MQVGIDISSLHSFSKPRGIGVYAKNLFEALKKYTKLDVRLVENDTDEKFDLIHYPYFDFFRPTLPLIKKIPTLVTIHDLIPLLFPQHYPPGIRGKVNLLRQKLALKNINGIIAPSSSTKKDITKILKINPDKIFTVYEAPAEDFKKIKDLSRLKFVNDKYNLPDKFALFVGGVNWNKNLINLAQACINTNLNLVLVGDDFKNLQNLDHPELKSFANFLERYENHPLINMLGFVEQKDLVVVYNLAQVLLLPSFYEGFGLPILEAQACGTPVITSDTSSMPEIAGFGAIYVDPASPDDIADKLGKALGDENLRNNLVEKGVANVKKYSWEKTALETVKVYEKIS